MIGTEGDLYGDFLRAVGERKLRKNGVRMVEHLLTVSPEYFRPESPEKAGVWNEDKLNAWLVKSVEFLKEEYGSNCIHAVCHVDEVTCHIHAYQVPLDYSKDPVGKLNASQWFNGKRKLSALQDRYADAVKPLGITRGIKKSKAKHQTIRSFYGVVSKAQQAIQPIPIALKASDLNIELSPLSIGALKNPIKYICSESVLVYKEDSGDLQLLSKRMSSIVRIVGGLFAGFVYVKIIVSLCR